MLKWVWPDAIDCATLIDFEYLAEGAPWTVEPMFGGQNAVIAVIQCCSAFSHKKSLRRDRKEFVTGRGCCYRVFACVFFTPLSQVMNLLATKIMCHIAAPLSF